MISSVASADIVITGAEEDASIVPFPEIFVPFTAMEEMVASPLSWSLRTPHTPLKWRDGIVDTATIGNRLLSKEPAT